MCKNLPVFLFRISFPFLCGFQFFSFSIFSISEAKFLQPVQVPQIHCISMYFSFFPLRWLIQNIFCREGIGIIFPTEISKISISVGKELAISSLQKFPNFHQRSFLCFLPRKLFHVLQCFHPPFDCHFCLCMISAIYSVPKGFEFVPHRINTIFQQQASPLFSSRKISNAKFRKYNTFQCILFQ